VDQNEMSEFIAGKIEESAQLKLSLDQEQIGILAQISQKMIDAYKDKKKVLIFGNGGSAADAQHIAAELVSKFYFDRDGLPAIALNTNVSILTAIGNDYGYERVFARQVEAMANAGDIVIGISTSGNSPNVLAALGSAKALGAYTVGLAGPVGSKICDLANITFNVPSTDTPRIQEVHITAGHIICEIVEKEMFPR